MAVLAVGLEEVERRLASADLELSGSEVHGLLSGLVCSGRGDAEALWLEELFPAPREGDLLYQECRRSLRRLCEQTRVAIDDPGLGFSLLLPDDESPIPQRAAAVVQWCQGFLYGIGIAGVSADEMLSGQAREALKDMSEITRMDLSGLEQSDEGDEDALMQITEFLRVAAMLVHEDLAHGTKVHS